MRIARFDESYYVTLWGREVYRSLHDKIDWDFLDSFKTDARIHKALMDYHRTSPNYFMKSIRYPKSDYTRLNNENVSSLDFYLRLKAVQAFETFFTAHNLVHKGENIGVPQPALESLEITKPFFIPELPTASRLSDWARLYHKDYLLCAVGIETMKYTESLEIQDRATNLMQAVVETALNENNLNENSALSFKQLLGLVKDIMKFTAHTVQLMQDNSNEPTGLEKNSLQPPPSFDR